MSLPVASASCISKCSTSGGINSDCKSSIVVCCKQNFDRVLAAMRKSGVLSFSRTFGILKHPSGVYWSGLGWNPASKLLRGVFGVLGWESKSDAVVLWSSSD